MNEAVDLGVIDKLVGYHIRRASNLFLADFNESVSDTGMRQVLIGILSIISENPGISQGRVGETLRIKRGNMSSLISELEERGLVQRTTVASNRRALSLTVSPNGQKVLGDCLVRIRQHEDRLLADLSSQERATLVHLLSRIEGPVSSNAPAAKELSAEDSLKEVS
ncbi:MarR family winged helix-turn-helix transcriptional regulator [Tsuneonella sp. HG222]